VWYTGVVCTLHATQNVKDFRMNLLNHDIATEFPQFKDKIQNLKASNAHFAKLFESYDTVNHGIAKIEMGADAGITDEALEIEKKKRLKFKDEIVHMLMQP
jgi:uncharacterized protein YdcH (DUF465 family)